MKKKKKFYGGFNNVRKSINDNIISIILTCRGVIYELVIYTLIYLDNLKTYENRKYTCLGKKLKTDKIRDCNQLT